MALCSSKKRAKLRTVSRFSAGIEPDLKVDLTAQCLPGSGKRKIELLSDRRIGFLGTIVLTGERLSTDEISLRPVQLLLDIAVWSRGGRLIRERDLRSEQQEEYRRYACHDEGINQRESGINSNVRNGWKADTWFKNASRPALQTMRPPLRQMGMRA